MDGPFGGQGALETEERGFGGVVGGLRLGVVGAVGGDGGDEEDGEGEVEGGLESVKGRREYSVQGGVGTCSRENVVT